MASSKGNLFKELFNSSSSLLGEGGFGEVRKVHRGDKNYAMKKSHHVNYLKSEAAILREFKNDPYIVQIENNNTSSNTKHYMLMEYLGTGTTLEKAISNGIIEGMSKETQKELLTNLVKGLSSIHKKGYIHQDIKDDNIWVYNDGTIKYIDFGLACKYPCTSPPYGTKKRDFLDLAITISRCDDKLSPALIDYSIQLQRNVMELDEADDVIKALEGLSGGARRSTCRRKKFAWNTRKVARSPFRNLTRAVRAEKMAAAGRSIGFTATSSLKSMGRMPRANGCYELGEKYQG